LKSSSEEELSMKDEYLDLRNSSEESSQFPLIKKQSIDSDFRAKYKTEICKFWALNKDCRYGDNVYLLFT